ncbi:TrkA C-terminal domain-containing protein [Gimesia sp.]|uniref:TrkA C-terminal domain-containing protein n=1 Tax=Gimesia sp. TaxID=2024833 RepID=UPI000C65F234|nr:TrkA C-terminal domain-containing protein [Gimesia sp.]MAX35485.1 potassium transporter TrkA [Gimesia sp.]HAH45068.1 potassium transporter TrkA [Planctomycetaceae bacterium]HBL43598.1 potassium transporter TrkA [Planctomycetaceae bacterium]|tara:strand:+ start:11884 stop:12642 length:759 start_codon:yes stop_codon:yes gene_type:complete
MFAIISLIVIIVVSIIVVRVATIALTLTGLSTPLARFQARSAFTSTGFTSSETEKVMRHPVRRKIIMTLMILGNAGIVTAISSLIISFVGADSNTGLWLRVALLAGGLSLLWMIAYSEWIDQRISRIIQNALQRWTDLEIRDYAGLLHLTDDYIVVELNVNPGDWLAEKTLNELKLDSEGILVLGIEKPDTTYVGAPRGETELEVNDRVLLYGKASVLRNLDERRSGAGGNWEHHKAVDEQKRSEQEQISQH